MYFLVKNSGRSNLFRCSKGNPRKILMVQIISTTLRKKRKTKFYLSAHPLLLTYRLDRRKIVHYFFGDFTNILNNSPPIIPPYKVLFKGFEVIAQVPLKQPIST